jgi:CHAT domain-containing protein
MHLRAFRSFLLTLLFAIALAATRAFAQAPGDAGLDALSNRVSDLYQAGKYREALPVAEQYAAAAKMRYGENAPQYALALGWQAGLLQATNHFPEAEPLYRRALAIDEKSFGPDDPKVAKDLSNLAQLLQAANRLSEAEPLMRRALAILEKSLAPDHPDVATGLNNLAQVLQAANRLSEAEPLMRRALAIGEKSLGPGHPAVAIRLGNLAALLHSAHRLSEAEPLMRRALAIDEQGFGPDHPNVARDLNNLALLLKATNRLSEAEPLIRRALAIDEKGFGPDHPRVAIRLSNLALLLQAGNRFSQAEPLYRRALAINEKSFGADHLQVGTSLNNLAALLQDTNRLSEAEPLKRRALAIFEKSLGPDHPEVASRLNNLAVLLKSTDRLSEAEPLYRRALAIGEKSLGPRHPNVATALNNLAALLEDQGRWQEAAALRGKAMPIMTGNAGSGEPGRGGLGNAVPLQNTGDLRAYTRALYHAGASDDAYRAQGFEAAQWALQTDAADAFSAMAARFAKGGEELAKLVRQQQDLLGAREAGYRSLDAAAGKADSKGAEAARAAISQIEARLAERQAALRRAFPEYTELANPKPLTPADVQALLGEKEALVLFLDLWQMGKVSEETIVFVLTKKEARWTSIGLGDAALRERVTALRCGLDAGAWGEAGRQKCREFTGAEPDFNSNGDAIPETLPFDLARASALYRDLFERIEDLAAGKRLLIVPSGALTQLPFEVLVTAKPDAALPRFEAYRKAVWLGQRQAITILPSVASLRALSMAKASGASSPFLGFGNPLLTGGDPASKGAKMARDKQDCGRVAAAGKSQTAPLRDKAGALFNRGAAVNVDELRKAVPLPETADELCAVAQALGAADPNAAVFLAERATVTQVKALSKSGELAKAKVVHFATHGALARETAEFAKNKTEEAVFEPALLLTPPAASKASEDDNGLLTASEVAQLNLDADWVIMSACNTAAGQSDNAGPLSGLARAFFYAGARALLVSHWYVDSEAAVAITTGAVNAMKAEPKTGRAEALRRSISAVIARGGRFAHPGIWGPFVLVGNGER